MTTGLTSRISSVQRLFISFLVEVDTAIIYCVLDQDKSHHIKLEDRENLFRYDALVGLLIKSFFFLLFQVLEAVGRCKSDLCTLQPPIPPSTVPAEQLTEQTTPNKDLHRCLHLLKTLLESAALLIPCVSSQASLRLCVSQVFGPLVPWICSFGRTTNCEAGLVDLMEATAAALVLVLATLQCHCPTSLHMDPGYDYTLLHGMILSHGPDSLVLLGMFVGALLMPSSPLQTA